jgi:hypothetical protein
MTEQQIIEMGFEHRRFYTHDQYMTNVYSKGRLVVEFTYINEPNGKLDSITLDANIQALNVSASELKALSLILNKKQ